MCRPEANDEDRPEPAVGDVVEYPLRTIETEDFNDGRSHGVGLLVSRNKDRGASFNDIVQLLPG